MRVHHLYEDHNVNDVTNDIINMYKGKGVEKTKKVNIIKYLNHRGFSEVNIDSLQEILDELDINTQGEYIIISQPNDDTDLPELDSENEFDPIKDKAIDTAMKNI